MNGEKQCTKDIQVGLDLTKVLIPLSEINSLDKLFGVNFSEQESEVRTLSDQVKYIVLRVRLI